MSEDRSLDDFAPRADGESERTDSDDPRDDAEGVEPATATSTWHTEGADCDQCGERTERRWRDGEEFVCADCAPW